MVHEFEVDDLRSMQAFGNGLKIENIGYVRLSEEIDSTRDAWRKFPDEAF